jgi:hypothetical protein
MGHLVQLFVISDNCPSVACDMADERAERLFGHSALGWGAQIRTFLHRREAAAMRLLCQKLRETVDSCWTFPVVCHRGKEKIAR